MPRQARKESGTGIYHVMMRGINHQNIFEDEEDNYQFINTLDRMRVRYDDDGNPCGNNCTYYAYCLMNNHFHLLSIVDGYSSHALGDDYRSVNLGGKIIPFVMLACNNCGFISHHALGSLDLLDRIDSDNK